MAGKVRLIDPHGAGVPGVDRGRFWNRLEEVSCESGATIVEFAVSASVLLLVVFGIIQCSLALYVYNYVSMCIL